MALSKADKHILATAGKGKVAYVLPEEPGYPIQGIGARYCQRIKGHGWVHTLFGHEKAMWYLANKENEYHESDKQRRIKAPVARLIVNNSK